MSMRRRLRSIIPNRPEAARRPIGKLGRSASLWVCYEAGPSDYLTPAWLPDRAREALCEFVRVRLAA